MKNVAIFFLSVCFAFGFRSYDQELVTFTGTPDYKFHLSSTHTLEPAKRKDLEASLELYAQKQHWLTDYFKKLNAGDNKGARKILETDKELKDVDEFKLAYNFTMLRMKELKLLYKPCVQVRDDKAADVIIFCSLEQFQQLEDRDKEFQFECRYVGELIVDNMKAYELVRFR